MDWSLLTTQQLIVMSEGSVARYPCHEMESCEPVAKNWKATTAPHAGELLIRLADGRTVTLQVEPGRPFVGFWNALRILKQTVSRRRKSGR
jgi:hypothetical protein